MSLASMLLAIAVYYMQNPVLSKFFWSLQWWILGFKWHSIPLQGGAATLAWNREYEFPSIFIVN